MSKGRSVTGAAAVPYFPRSRHIEAAKHLRLTVTRYIADRATLNDIHEAVAMLVSEAPVTGEPGYRAAETKYPEWILRTTINRVCRLQWDDSEVGLWSADGPVGRCCKESAKYLIAEKTWLPAVAPVDAFPPNYGLKSTR